MKRLSCIYHKEKLHASSTSCGEYFWAVFIRDVHKACVC